MSNKKGKMVKVRHSSLEMKDPEAVVKAKKNQDMLGRAKNKWMFLTDVLKHNKNAEGGFPKKSRTQATLEYFFKSSKEKNQIIPNNGVGGCENGGKRLQKQKSVGSYPIRIEVCDEDGNCSTISRVRPATVCVDKVSEDRGTAALALERPRKKLSFREPEIMDRVKKGAFSASAGRKAIGSVDANRSVGGLANGRLHLPLDRVPSVDSLDLESQAMRVVRTIGQAFEVCHKLSITAPENDNLDQDEQDTLTQDLLSDQFSDFISDKPKKDLISEGASDKMSLPPDDISFKDSTISDSNRNIRPPQLDILPPPPNSNTRRSPLASAETYASPHSDGLTSGSGSGGSSSLPPAGSALSSHHEIQLLKEQLDQQSQQTQACIAQLQLAREQLAAEQSARLEAQARTHQLLVHNRELLDHIAALVAHLQGGEKANSQQSQPHVAMPQQPQQQFQPPNDNNYLPDVGALDNSAVLQALGLNPSGLIENRAATSCLPPSPLRTTFNPSGAGLYNFPYPASTPSVDQALDSQLLQRLQSLCAYSQPPAPYPYNSYSQTLQYLQQGLYNPPPLLNNNYTLPLVKKYPSASIPSSPLTMRHSLHDADVRQSPTRHSEPRQFMPSSQQPSNAVGGQQQNYQQQPQNYPQQPQNYQQQQQNYQQNYQQQQTYQPQQESYQQSGQQHLQVQPGRQQRQCSPKPQQASGEGGGQEGGKSQFIRPLSQMGALTTTDASGRVRVIVPVPANSVDEADGSLANLRLRDDLRLPGTSSITRSTSEKVPNRSELMSQVQRTAWARHTTK